MWPNLHETSPACGERSSRRQHRRGRRKVKKGESEELMEMERLVQKYRLTMRKAANKVNDAGTVTTSPGPISAADTCYVTS